MIRKRVPTCEQVTVVEGTVEQEERVRDYDFKVGREKTGGRTKGTPNRKTLNRYLEMKYSDNDLLPHEFLLKVCRGHEIEVTPPNSSKRLFVTPTLQQRIDAANKAAPYYAPRLSTVEVIQGLNDSDLESIIQGAAAQAGVEIRFDENGQPIISTVAQAKVGI